MSYGVVTALPRVVGPTHAQIAGFLVPSGVGIVLTPIHYTYLTVHLDGRLDEHLLHAFQSRHLRCTGQVFTGAMVAAGCKGS